MFADASAIVAMMLDEGDADTLTARLNRYSIRTTSPISFFEATAAIARLLSMPANEASRAVQEFLTLANISVTSIPAEATPLAIDAFFRFGKGQPHPARLNIRDCFAYACARHYGRPLLYKRDDFARTDMETA
jgi:ribonuclease VapC